MANLLDAMKPVAHDGVNGFDRSFRDVLSAKPGMAIPLRPIDVVPHSHIKIDVGQICETTTLQTNAFARAKQNLDFYFVPYSQIFHKFFDVYTGRGENKRAVLSPMDYFDGSFNGLPYVQKYDILINLFTRYINRRPFTFTLSGQSYNNVSFDTEEMFVDFYYDIFGNDCVVDMIRLLDNLGYGNYIPVFNQLAISVFSPIAAAGHLQDNDVIFSDDSYVEEGVYVRDALIDAIEHICYGNEGLKSERWNVFRLAAYHKVFADMLRNFEYDNDVYYADAGVSYPYEYLYNFDYVEPSNLDLKDYFPDDSSMVYYLLCPHYVQWKKDLFTQHYPTTQFGNVASFGLEDFELVVSHGIGSGTPLQTTNASASQPPKVTGSNQPTAAATFKTNPILSFSAIDVRLTMAQQRWRERILRASNRQKDLLKATFGVQSKFVDDEYCVYLGSYDGSLNINKVASTSKTDNGDIGELGAYGTSGLSGRTIECTCSDFGVIIPIFSFVPEGEYNSYGISPFNLKLDGDSYFKQDFENLGLQPVFRHELYNLPIRIGEFNEDDVIGYTVANHEYKTDVDLVHGEFYSQLPLVGNFTQRQFGAFADYVTPRNLFPFLERDKSMFYVSPNSMDNIFLVSVDNKYMSTDPFKLNFYFKVYASQPMNVTGLPAL